MHDAIAYRHYRAVELLIDSGANVNINSMDNFGDSILGSAYMTYEMWHSMFCSITILTIEKLNFTITNDRSGMDSLKAIELLINRGANVNDGTEKNWSNRTFLHRTISSGNSFMVQFICHIS